MTAPARGATSFLPGRHQIDSYGKGGFAFGGMSHRGSLLCLPDGIRGWPVARAQDISEVAFAPVFAQASALSLLLIGTGWEPWDLPEPLRLQFQQHRLAVELMRTGTAVSTYNILLGEGRPVAAALIAVD